MEINAERGATFCAPLREDVERDKLLADPAIRGHSPGTPPTAQEVNLSRFATTTCFGVGCIQSALALSLTENLLCGAFVRLRHGRSQRCADAHHNAPGSSMQKVYSMLHDVRFLRGKPPRTATNVAARDGLGIFEKVESEPTA
ncbi:hypothetical protein [Dyella sp. ASV21]|uniref:hypothetical protein n=1 Tax=Dyella sp. ASV21 TaxID=2795114 RepID=UPI0018EDFC49|nr:hypothetical protein [Dyella sp. ASV21]